MTDTEGGRDRGSRRGGWGGRGGRGGGTARGGGSSTYIDYNTLSCFCCSSDSHYKDGCTKMPSKCHCSHCNVDGHVTAVCIKKLKKESANMSEVKEEKKEETGGRTHLQKGMGEHHLQVDKIFLESEVKQTW